MLQCCKDEEEEEIPDPLDPHQRRPVVVVVPPVERTPLLGANGIDDETGREFLPRIRSELKPEASEEDVEKAKKEALMILAGMPQVHLITVAKAALILCSYIRTSYMIR